MISIPIWLFIVFIITSIIFVIVFIFELVAYCSVLEIEKEHKNKK